MVKKCQNYIKCLAQLLLFRKGSTYISPLQNTHKLPESLCVLMLQISRISSLASENILIKSLWPVGHFFL